MQPQVNSQNITPEASFTPTRVERGEANQPDQLAGAQPERQAASSAERGQSQPSGPSSPQALSQTPQVVSQAATSTLAPAVTSHPQPALTTAGGDTLEKAWIDKADAIIQTKAQDPYAEEEAHEELSAQYLKQRFNLDIKRSTPQQ